MSTHYRTPVELVAEFSEKFDVPKDPELWTTLVREEQAEFIEAVANLLKEAADLIYVIAGLLNALGNNEDEAAKIVDNVLLEVMPPDVVPFYVAVMSHPRLADVIGAVHRSNLSKLGDDGKPIRREDGKILKGPNYKAPDILSLITKSDGTVH